MLIGIFGALLFIVAIGWLVYSLIKKQGAKKPLIAMLAGFILFIVGIATDSDDADETAEVEDSEETVATDDSGEEVKEEVEEETENDEDIVEEEKIEDDDTYEIIDGVAVFTDDSTTVISAKQDVESFSYEMTQLLKEHHDEIDNGAIFRSVRPLTDQYGEEEKHNVIVVYYTPETIEKINYDNWPTLDASGLYETADSMWIHQAYNEKSELEDKSDVENTPELYYDYMGSTVDE